MNKGLFFLGVIALVAAGVGAAKTRTLWHQLGDYSFENYVKEFGKSYTGNEYAQRKAIFEARLEKINEHNKDTTQTWKKGINHLSDRTDKEFKRLLGYKKVELPLGSFKPLNYEEVRGDISVGLPDHVDWRGSGIVSPVKDQGQCGSCWSFGSAETIESHWAMQTGELSVLSEQQILDCTSNPNDCGGTGGCQGGTAELAYQMVMSFGGLADEWTYPYQSYFGVNYQCRFNSSNTVPIAKLSNYVKLPSNKQEPLMEAVANKGPIAISVDASSWAEYETGVFDGCNQTNPDIDHSVQLVGYGTDPTLGPYWLVRNSWSPLWGEKGYIRVKRSATARCGTDITPSDGTGCNNGPSSVTVCGTCGILYDSCYPIVAH